MIDDSSSIGPIRTGETVDFGIRSKPGRVGNDLEFTFAYHVDCFPKTQPLHLGITRCIRTPDGLTFGCEDMPGLGTASLPGQQFQPRIEVADLSAAQDGSLPDVRYAFYEVDGMGLVADHVRVMRSTDISSATGGITFEPLPGLIVAGVPGPAAVPRPEPTVCPANYGSGGLYWGDYFAFRAVPPGQSFPSSGLGPGPAHVAIYSSDEQRGCQTPPINAFQGRHLHVVAGSWGD